MEPREWVGLASASDDQDLEMVKAAVNDELDRNEML